MKKKLTETRPIERFLIPFEKRSTDFFQEFVRDYMVLCEIINESGLSPVEYHKKWLGKQDTCFFNGEFRFWVWHSDNWVVLVNNRKGVCLELVSGEYTKKEAMKEWAYYLEAVIPSQGFFGKWRKMKTKLKVGDIIMLPIQKMDSYLSGNLLLVVKLKPPVGKGQLGSMKCWDFSRKTIYNGGNPHYTGWIKVV